MLETSAAAATEDNKGAQYDGGTAKALANEMQHQATNPSTGSCRLLCCGVGWGGRQVIG